jgi:uncharacterized protein (TIGR02284 family)
MTAEALKMLHAAMLDTREGYEVAEKNAATPALRSFFGEMVALRTKDHEEIHRVLNARGDHPSDGGSFMATVHRAATSVRAAALGMNEDALAPFISGEKKIIEEYDAAIEEADNSATTRDMLLAQRTALMAKVSEMESMKVT